jgi:hypothetical protein
MRTQLGAGSTRCLGSDVPAASVKAKLLTLVEVLVVCGVTQALLASWRRTAIHDWESQRLGWSYAAGERQRDGQPQQRPRRPRQPAVRPDRGVGV